MMHGTTNIKTLKLSIREFSRSKYSV